jgi:hypothetical protein
MSFADWIPLITGVIIESGFIFLMVFLWKIFNEEPKMGK